MKNIKERSTEGMQEEQTGRWMLTRNERRNYSEMKGIKKVSQRRMKDTCRKIGTSEGITGKNEGSINGRENRQKEEEEAWDSKEQRYKRSNVYKRKMEGRKIDCKEEWREAKQHATGEEGQK